jgi:threonine dehydrogenase-like Zn-dependent dehydrogenase
VDAVVEVVGVADTFKQSIEVSRMGGRIVIAGVHSKPMDGLIVDRIFRKELTIQTTKGAAPLRGADGVPLAFRYIQEGIARPLELLTPFAITDAQAAFMGQAHGSIIKAVLIQ